MNGSSETRDAEPSGSRSTAETTAGQCSSEALPEKLYLPKGLTPWLVFLIAILWHSADRLIIPPLNRLLEANICRVYYCEHDPSFIDGNDQVPEHLCKVDSIQIQLALLLGAIQTIGLVCELVSTFPLGYASDRFGRKTILYINLICMASGYGWAMIVGYWYNTFSVNATIAAPFLYLLGGYVNVTNTNLLALIADVSDDNVYRTTMFGYYRSAGQVTRLLTPALAAYTMTINLWLPFWIGVGVYLVALPMVMLLPDTRRNHTSSARPHSLDVPFAPGEGQSLLNSDELADDDVLNDHEPSASSKRPGFTTTLDKGLRQAEIELQDYLKLFRSSRNVALCLLIFLVTSLSDNNLNVLLQYVSKRYGWTISQAAYLFSLKAAVNVLLYTVIVPVSLAYLVSRWSFTSAHANFWAQKASIVLLCLGSLAIGLSFNIGLLIASLVFYSLGWGISVFNLSLLTHAAFEILDDEHTGRIYSVMGFFETIGSLVGVPLMAGTWALGIKIGGFGLGLPFFICAGLYFAATIVTWFMRFESPVIGEEIDTGDTVKKGSMIWVRRRSPDAQDEQHASSWFLVGTKRALS